MPALPALLAIFWFKNMGGGDFGRSSKQIADMARASDSDAEDDEDQLFDSDDGSDDDDDNDELLYAPLAPRCPLDMSLKKPSLCLIVLSSASESWSTSTTLDGTVAASFTGTVAAS